ncbi:MAG: universal stress protein [Micropruina sp.]|nr:universal stress protein [Micropruina sp.]
MDAELPIVVGHDGSRYAQLALNRALWLARQLKVPVHVVRAWSISTAPRPATWSPGYVPPADDFEAAVRERLERDVAAALTDYPDVDVTLFTPHGPPIRELLKACRGARLVVVGTRGKGGVKDMLMGSVSQHITHNALTDVLIVRRVSDRDKDFARRHGMGDILDP